MPIIITEASIGIFWRKQMTVDMVLGNSILQVGAADTGQASAVAEAGFSETLRTSLFSNSVDLDAIFDEAGRRHNLSPDLLKAVARVESNFRPEAVSRAGAMGIMQLMPGTARGLGVTDAFDPYQNIIGGAKYLRQMLDRFDGDLDLALAAYNAGPGTVGKHGGVPAFSHNYINRVKSFFGGNPITAGTAYYSGKADSGSALSEVFNLGALSEMLLMKIVEMQMSSSEDENRWAY